MHNVASIGGCRRCNERDRPRDVGGVAAKRMSKLEWAVQSYDGVAFAVGTRRNGSDGSNFGLIDVAIGLVVGEVPMARAETLLCVGQNNLCTNGPVGKCGRTR